MEFLILGFLTGLSLILAIGADFWVSSNVATKNAKKFIIQTNTLMKSTNGLSLVRTWLLKGQVFQSKTVFDSGKETLLC